MGGGRPSPSQPWPEHGPLAILVKADQKIITTWCNDRGVPYSLGPEFAGKKVLVIEMEKKKEK